MFGHHTKLCGCWFPVLGQYNRVEKQYLPQVDLESHTTILATTSRTTLKQVFVNSSDKKLDEVQYTFPLYDGVSVVGFKCTVASKVLVGIVKEKQQARTEYGEAVARGETAGLLEQLPEASDVFTTKVGNVPAGERIHVEIIYLGELKHDAEVDGSRFTIPTNIAPRYGPTSDDSAKTLNTTHVSDKGGIKILVDVALQDGVTVRGVQSPSHPIALTMGRTSTMDEDAFENNHASATLTLGSTELDKDFIIVIQAKGLDTPRAMLETHPTVPNQRALMTTLVPKFSIPNISPEIVFVVDRSGSMGGKIPLLVAAMKIFLKSLPASGVKFNICSFGSSYSFLFKKSKTYDQSSLQEALFHLNSFDANYGGTEMLEPVKATVKNRYKDMPLEVMVLTDGEIWNQDTMFEFINEQKNARFFSLGIGHGASSALVEGIARAGNGFAQFVGENEKMDKRVVRMLKGALTPHITDYQLEVRYEKKDSDDMSDDDFEIVESFKDSTQVVVTELTKPVSKGIISLFNTSAKEEPTNPPAGRYDGLPKIDNPKVLQAPHKVPSLFAFNRTTVYLLLGPESCQQTPKSVVLKGTSEHGPLELEIPVQDVGKGETIHQLAAKKAIQELEEGRGWITEAKVGEKLLKTKYEGRWDLLVEREAVRLGVEFQVGGKWCSFIAVEKKLAGEGTKTGGENDSSMSQESEKKAYEPSSHVGKSPFAPTNSGFPAPRPFVSSFCPVPRIPQSRSLFGASSTSGNLFGNTISGVSQANQPFGSSTARCFGASAGFGSTNTSSGALFGNKTSPQGASTGTSSLFGNVQHVQHVQHVQNQGPPPAGGLFGSTTSSNSFQVGSSSNEADGRPTSQASISCDRETNDHIDYHNALFLDLQPSIQPGGSQASTVSLANPSDTSTAGPQVLSSFRQFGATSPATSSRAGLNMTPAPLLAQPSGAQQEQEEAGAEDVIDYSDEETIQADSPVQADTTIAADTALGGAVCKARKANTGNFLGSVFGSASASMRARKSTGGAAPRQQLASMAPMKSMACAPPAMQMGASRSAAPMPAMAAAAPKTAMKEKGSAPGGRGGGGDRRMRMKMDMSMDMDDDEGTVKREEGGAEYSTISDDEKMHVLIGMQEFDGHWEGTEPLWKLLGVGQGVVKGMAAEEMVKATAFAVAWLEGKMSSQEDVWEMLVEKAREWLAAKIGKAEEIETLVSGAKTIVLSA